jgi:hypothetical protein
MVTDLISPYSRLGLSIDHERLLDELSFWFSKPKVLKAIVRASLMSLHDLDYISKCIILTQQGKLDRPVLSLKHCVRLVIHLLSSRDVRMQIAREMAAVGKASTKTEAMKSLWSLREQLYTEDALAVTP